MTYTEEEQNEIISDLEKLWNDFKRFAHETQNGRFVQIHLPPALMEAVSGIIESNFPRGIIEYSEFVQFAGQMFIWGQSAASVGLLAANMTPCKCGVPTDEELEAWISKK